MKSLKDMPPDVGLEAMGSNGVYKNQFYKSEFVSIRECSTFRLEVTKKLGDLAERIGKVETRLALVTIITNVLAVLVLIYLKSIGLI